MHPDPDFEPLPRRLDGPPPPGAIGEVMCAVCRLPGWLMDANDRGFRIVHPGRLFDCRAPR